MDEGASPGAAARRKVGRARARGPAGARLRPTGGALGVAMASTLALAGCAGSVSPPPAPPGPLPAERAAAHGFPKLALSLQFCCPGPVAQRALASAADWDVLLVDAEWVHTMPEQLGPAGALRSRNPDAILLAYFSGGDANPHNPGPVTASFMAGVEEDWLLHDVSGGRVPLFELGPGEWTWALDPGSDVAEALPAHLAREVLGGGLVDGIFLDWASSEVAWLNHRVPAVSEPIDLDGDGRPEPDAEVDAHWIRGYRRMLAEARRAFPAGAPIVGNAGWNGRPVFVDLLQGITIEAFLAGAEVDPQRFGWSAIMRTYGTYATSAPEPRLSIVVANSDDADDFGLVRFALASTLLHDGYFAFTNRTGAYVATRWYDEYAVDLASGRAVRDPAAKGWLGSPLDVARSVDARREELARAVVVDPRRAERTVWRRDFEHGVVLVNPGEEAREIELEPGLRRIEGSVDPDHNDGAAVRRLTLPPGSGEVLVRTTPVPTRGGGAAKR